MSWTLAYPLALLLLPLPLLARLVLPAARGHAGALIVPDGLAAAALKDGSDRALLNPGLMLRAAVWILLVIALAGPERTGAAPALPASGRDVMLAIDVSGSMERDDFEIAGQAARRIDAVKAIAADFVLGRGSDRIGLVVFGDRAHLAAPLTFDVAAVARSVEAMAIGIAGRSTAISDGLGLAMKRLRLSDAPGRVVILLSDGTNTAGAVAPVEAARLARTLGIRIHTIALGPDKDDARADARNLVDEVTLSAIADASGGQAFRVRTTADLAAVSAEIDRLEASGTDRPPVVVRHAYWPWLASAALMLTLALTLPWRLRSAT